MKHIRLLREFARRPKEVGIVFPSSERLAKTITSGLDIENARKIAEIGPGTAVFTPHILKRLHKDAKFFAVEKNDKLCEMFEKKFPGVKIYNGDALHIRELARDQGLPGLDVVVSGLPWALFPLRLQMGILKAVSLSLTEGGRFATYAYVQGTVLPGGVRLKKILCRYFSEVRTSKIVWSNLPPAFVYRCKK